MARPHLKQPVEGTLIASTDQVPTLLGVEAVVEVKNVPVKETNRLLRVWLPEQLGEVFVASREDAERLVSEYGV